MRVRYSVVARFLAASLLIGALSASGAAADESGATNDGSAAVQIVELPYAQAVINASGYQGNMLIVDMHEARYLAAFPHALEQQHIPASTFKIMSSLVALHSGVVAGADTVLPWDGVIRGRIETNTDLTLRDAFRLSSVPHYQALVREIGEHTMQAALTEAAYGNESIFGGIDQFWLTGGLRISLMQQIDLLRQLYNDELPFAVDAMHTVKEIMLVEATDAYVLRAKTGLAVLSGNENTGWWVGWVEHGEKVTLFATVLTTTAPASDFIPARLAVTRAVLTELGVLP